MNFCGPMRIWEESVIFCGTLMILWYWIAMFALIGLVWPHLTSSGLVTAINMCSLVGLEWPCMALCCLLLPFVAFCGLMWPFEIGRKGGRGKPILQFSTQGSTVFQKTFALAQKNPMNYLLFLEKWTNFLFTYIFKKFNCLQIYSPFAY